MGREVIVSNRPRPASRKARQQRRPPSRFPWVIAAVVVVAAAVAIALTAADETEDQGGPSAVAAPPVDAAAERGREPYETTCAVCHGRDLKGSSAGPPLLNRIYEPGHHPDESFRRAVKQGVQAHHWNFGDMPAQSGVSDEEIARIIAFVRAQQKRVGIS